MAETQLKLALDDPSDDPEVVGDTEPEPERIVLEYGRSISVKLIVGSICLSIFISTLNVALRSLPEFVHFLLRVLSSGVIFGTLTSAVRYRIDFSNEGIQFSSAFKGPLHEQLYRGWNDVHAIDLVNASESLVPQSWQERSGPFGENIVLRVLTNFVSLFSEGDKLTFYFKSGGSASVRLSRLTRAQGRELVSAIERYCDQTKVATPILALERFLMLDSDQNLNRTELWLEDLSRHWAATNFATLPSGHKLLDGRLKILIQISGGGMSAVYLAESSDETKVIVKEAFIPSEVSVDLKAKATELFNRQVKVLQKLSHPQIVQVIDHFVEFGRDYLVLQYVPGMTLRQMRKSSEEPSERVILDLALQIAEILIYLHSQEPPIVHRDLTPDNLVLDKSNQIVLIDFGVASEVIGTATRTIVGKQSYMAPEQLRGKAAPRSDIYAFGATLHFLITGQDPIPLTQSHPVSINKEISKALSDIVAECTAYDGEQRLVSAQILKQRLESLNDHADK
jgi:tRNA A-37 threonylcarbamoyl transferase component Bud32